MNDLKPVDEAVITYADFLRICRVTDAKDFGGFVVKRGGLYVKKSEKKTVAWELLDQEERDELLWHPTGHYDEPALRLPCSLPELRSFENNAGLAGSIDEDLLTEVLAAKRQTHTGQPIGLAPVIKPASKAPPPITPARGSAPSWVGRPPAVRPSWDEWVMMDAVTVCEAAALSLDLEPRRHGPNDRYFFPDDQTFNKFGMRCRIIEEGDWHATGRSEYRVSLPAFAAWAVAKGMDMPAELRALAGVLPEPETTPAPRASAGDEPLQSKGITKQEVLSVEWPLHGKYNQSSLSDALSDVPDWLVDARVLRGAPGKASSLWNPAKIADFLLDKTYANQKALDTLIRNHFSEWLTEWEQLKEYR